LRSQRLEALAQERHARVGELPADLRRDLMVAERAAQRDLREVADRAGVLEPEGEKAQDLRLDAVAGRRQRAGPPLLLSEALDDGEEQAALPAELALDQLLVDARREQRPLRRLIAPPWLSSSPEVKLGIFAERAGVTHYDSRSDRAFTSSLRCRKISVVLRISGSLRATHMVDAIESSRAFSSR
jgi:hypothetical protein